MNSFFNAITKRYKFIDLIVSFFLLTFGFFFLYEIYKPTWLIFSKSLFPSQIKSNRILLWHQEEPENSKIIVEWIQKFSAQNKDINIEVQYYPVEEMREKFVTAASAGQAADLIWGVNDMAGVFFSAGLIQSVTPFIETQHFIKSSLSPVKIDNQILGIPISFGNNLMLFYNKEFVKNPPLTMKDLIESAKNFQIKSSEEKRYGLVFFQSEPFWIAPFLIGFDAWPIEVEKGVVSIELNSNKKNIIKALHYFRDLKFKHLLTPPECDYHCAYGLFTEKKALYTINGDWSTVELKKALGDSLGIAPLPIVNETGRPLVPLIGGRYVFINSKLSYHKKQNITKFLNYLTSLDVQKEVAFKLKRVPTTQGALADPEVQGLKDISDFRAASASSTPMPPYPEMRALWDGMRPAQQKLMSGEITPEESFELMLKTIPEKLNIIKGR